MNILIVEDVRKEAEILKTIVSKIQGLEGIWCSSAGKAVALFEENSFDLFILDVQLSGCDGFSLAEQIRRTESYQLTPILFVAGSNSNSLDALKKHHCYYYIEKTCQQQELYEKLLNLTIGLSQEKEKQLKPADSNHAKEFACIRSRNGVFYIKKSELLILEIRRGGWYFLLNRQGH